MRRFELVEGTSSKFWQIVQDGVSFTVTYGRIGTPGTAQTKTFDTAAKATLEHDKLIAEKLKKGYSEGGSAPGGPAPAAKTATKAAAPTAAPAPAAPASAAPAAAAPAPAPSPATAVPAAPAPAAPPSVPGLPNTDTVRIALQPEDLAELVPVRGVGAPPPRPGPDTATAGFAAAQAGWREWKCAKFWKAKGPLAAELKAAKAFMETDGTGPLEVDVQAVLAEMIGLGGENYALSDDALTGLMAFWTLTGSQGPAFAVRVLLRLSTLGPNYGTGDIAARYESPNDEIDPVNPVTHETANATAGWKHLGRLLATVSDAQFAEARTIAAAAWSGLQHAQRVNLLLAFPGETGWADELGQAWLDNIEAWQKTTGYRNPEFGLRYRLDLTEALLRRHLSQPWVGNGTEEAAFAWIAWYGADALRLLERSLAKAEWKDTRATLLTAIGRIEGPDSAKIIAAQIGDRELRAPAAEWLKAHPVLSVPALAALLAARGKLSGPAETLLTALLNEAPVVVDAIAPSLTGAGRGALEALRDRLAVPPEAAPEALPGVLVNPPWRSKAKRPEPPVVTGLSPPARPERVLWAPRERERLQGQIADWARSRKTTLKKVRAQIEESRHGSQMGYTLTGLPDADALTLWNELETESFRWSGGALMFPLARHEVAAVDGYLKHTSMSPVEVAEALSHVDAVRLGPYFARNFGGKSLRKHAETWMIAFPETATLGIIPVALGPAGKERATAEAALRWLATKGRQLETLRRAGDHYGPAARAALNVVLEADPRDLCPSKAPKLPTFWTPAAFPRPLLKGRAAAFTLPAVEALGEMLAFSPADAPYAGLDDVLEAGDPASLEAFAWALFNAWLLAGAESKQNWAFLTLAVLGGDDVARRLTPLIREWPGESAQARAVLGLDLLARIGTDVALMHLHGVAQKIRFKALQERAREKIDEVAADRGLTADELADRLVPDLDLDEDGSRTLDFGPRQFRVVFDESLKPAVQDDAGKLLPDLPKPNSKDDAEKSKETVELWKALKKDAKTVASGQITRLELAMCRRRRWPAAGFRTFLLEHPLVVHLVRRLVWGVYVDGRLGATFRVAEDRSLADVEDLTFALPQGAEVGLPHALELSAELASGWGQVFADYKLLQPFPQLGRDTYAPTPAEATGTTLTRVNGRQVPSGKLLGLDLKGWRKGPPQDAGCIFSYDKPLTAALSIELGLTPGLNADMAYTEPVQTLEGVSLSSNDDELKAAFSLLDPIAFSELVRDLMGLLEG